MRILRSSMTVQEQYRRLDIQDSLLGKSEAEQQQMLDDARAAGDAFVAYCIAECLRDEPPEQDEVDAYYEAVRRW